MPNHHPQQLAWQNDRLLWLITRHTLLKSNLEGSLTTFVGERLEVGKSPSDRSCILGIIWFAHAERKAVVTVQAMGDATGTFSLGAIRCASISLWQHGSYHKKSATFVPATRSSHGSAGGGEVGIKTDISMQLAGTRADVFGRIQGEFLVSDRNPTSYLSAGGWPGQMDQPHTTAAPEKNSQSTKCLSHVSPSQARLGWPIGYSYSLCAAF